MLLQPKDEITQTLTNFKEGLQQRISSQETKITNELKKEWEELQAGMSEAQHQRNRAIIQEIVETTQRFGEETSKCTAPDLFREEVRGVARCGPVRMIGCPLCLYYKH